MTKTEKGEKARSFMRSAISRGLLPQISTCTCVDCGAQAAEYHHHVGYEEAHWLDVIPLCRECHLARHHRLVRDTKKPNTRTAQHEVRLQFVVDRKYKNALAKLADLEGDLSMTDMFRLLIRNELKRRNLDLVALDSEGESTVSNGSAMVA